MAKLTDAQQRVVNHDHGNILVSASAGSGKTHTMIERVIRLILENKAHVEQVLAVTFTEKAASDMKEKLKSALIKAYQVTKESRLIGELNRLPTADISTIHSFCARLVRLYFFKVGVSPDFKIADTADSAELITTALDKTLREFYTANDSDFLELMDMHAVKRSDKAFRKLVLGAYEFCTNEPDFFEFTQKYKGVLTKDGIDKFAIEYKKKINRKISLSISGLKECSNYFGDRSLVKCKAFCDGVISDIYQMICLPDAYALEEFFKYNRTLSVERDLDEQATVYKERAVALRDKVKTILKNVSANLPPKEVEKERVKSYYSHIEQFVKVVNRFNQVYSKEKREENILDFGDLEQFALEILKDEEIQAEVKERYKYIFIDEYQDVNTVQEQILTCVSDNNLLMVGDLKQGIYAFRGCRAEIFADKLKTMPQKGQTVVRLNENFRSASAVVNAVNKVFDFCMTDEYFEENYKGNSDLVFGGLFPEEYQGRASLHYLVKEKQEKQKEQPRVYDILQEISKPAQDENADIVSLVTKIINDELSKTIYDVKKNTERPVRYGDIAILARARNSDYTKMLVKGLVSRGIPVVADAKENVCDYPEIAMLVNALKLVDSFSQDIPLASTLKGHIGGFTDEDLFDIVSFCREKSVTGSFFDAYFYYIQNAETPLRERLIEFDDYFKKIRFISDFQGAQGVLNKLIKDKDLESYLLAESGGKTRALRLKRFVMATSNNGKTLTVKEFLNRIEKSDDAFSLFECGDENAVSVMTMHASKGLEFPVVIACGLEREFDSRDDKTEILFNRKYGFVPRYYDRDKRTKDKTLFRAAVVSEQAEERLKEEMRLFYVALTRATYSLHMVFSDTEDKRTDEFLSASKFYQFIPKSMPVEIHTSLGLAFEKMGRGRRKVLIGECDDRRCAEMKKRFSADYPFKGDITLPLKSDVTTATKNFGQDYYNSRVLFEDEVTDIERGNIAHKIMELLDFSFKLSFAEQVQKLIVDGELTAEQVGMVNLERIERAIVDADMKSLCSNGQRYSEKEFLTEVSANMIFPELDSGENVVLQGVIDLLIIDGDNAKIIDYKYSKLDKKGLESKYYKQLELYAYAVEKVLNKKVTVKKIVNLFTGETQDIV